ncbi:muscarinic acetylcholine receptor M3-like [Acanthaster planci]|uniref:Muscarinic acetylcholine receptor M3-like n=1 Tax=Acanthaster planci TaxID=133434 RepID=A0A8B7XVU8_ACAPL|nr:muscarinic acetylcholine receptor M3-like [Acanthaster planci]
MGFSTFQGTEYSIMDVTEAIETDSGGQTVLTTFQVTIAVLSGIFSFITVLGNLLVLFAFCVERRLRTYINYFIVALSFADLVAGAFTMPLYTVYWVLGFWPFGTALCDIYMYINHVFIHISLLGILVLAVDRYQAVYQPLKHLQKRTLRHASFMISIFYIIPFTLWLPWCLLWPYFAGARRIRDGFCYPQYVVDSLAFSILAPICFFWIPAPIISVLYWRIYVVIRRRSSQKRGPVMMQELETSSNSCKTKQQANTVPPSTNQDIADPELGHDNPGFEPNFQGESGDTSGNAPQIDSTGQNRASLAPDTPKLHTRKSQLPILDSIDQQVTHQSSKRQAEGKIPRAASSSIRRTGRESRNESNRATRTLTLIFVVLIVSSLPWSILVIVYALCPKCIPLVLYQSSVYIAHMNSTVNPFCYAIANPLYLQAISKLVCCGRRTTGRGSRR